MKIPTLDRKKFLMLGAMALVMGGCSAVRKDAGQSQSQVLVGATSVPMLGETVARVQAGLQGCATLNANAGNFAAGIKAAGNNLPSTRSAASLSEAQVAAIAQVLWGATSDINVSTCAGIDPNNAKTTDAANAVAAGMKVVHNAMGTTTNDAAISQIFTSLYQTAAGQQGGSTTAGLQAVVLAALFVITGSGI